MFQFEVTARDGGARTGRLITPHGAIETPAFVAVGTQATVKAVSPEELREIGVQVIIANTYHLHLQPGEDLIEELGGLHRFMNWNGPLMTDSGGFQVFSLGAGKEHGVGKIAPIFPEEEAGLHDRGGHFKARGTPLVRVDEEGVEFISHLDGSRHRFTPEKVIQIERKLGADIILVLDECTSPLHDYAYTKEAMERTHRWAVRAIKEFERTADGRRASRQALFGIVQGGAYRDLREASARFISSLEFQGFAIGGSLGKSKQEMLQVLEWTIPLLPEGKPRHLLGIGEIEDIFAAVERGIDMFDCVAPTRMARNGALFSREAEAFRLRIRNAHFKADPRPVEEGCRCYTCRNYSRAYLRHLFEAKELLAMRLATIHNLFFLEELMRQVREAIRKGRLAELRKEWLSGRTKPMLSSPEP
jgi:queuine tRNA-ribosyltransferase/7-cyano-7-deazaguanine tRNA-ribosyltransferase